MKNPFIAGNWVRGENFFGRAEIITDILEGAYKYLWIVGTRRFGKTSLLKQIEFTSSQPPYAEKYISLFWNMQGAGNLEGLIESLLESIEDVEDRFEDMGISVTELEDKSISEILRALRRGARQNNRILLLLCDECEELINVKKENPEILPKLRRIFQKGESMLTVITATKRLSRLDSGELSETSPFLHGFIPPVPLLPLGKDAAENLINRGYFAPEVAQEIIDKSNSHPYLIQLLCKRLFDGGSFETVLTETANDDMIAHFFAIDFDYLIPSEKKILLHVLENKNIHTSELQKKTLLRSDSMINQVNSLIQLGYLRKSGSEINISNYFFEHWLKREKSRLFPEFTETLSGGPQAASPAIGAIDTLVGSQIGHYRIEAELGSGGMGYVFKAVDKRLDRTVALKLLDPAKIKNQEFRDRFYTEARASSALNHTNIATLYDIDETNSQLYISMEYVDGATLGKWRQNFPDDFETRLHLAIQIAEGLACAHQHGIVHRDIKPDNIMVSRENIIKITDFGLAKILKSENLHLTKTGTTLGTLAYMSPEQTAGLEADHRTDIYSFGVVLFELFTGNMPYKSTNEAGLLYSIMNDPPPLAREISQEIPEKLEQLIHQMMQKERKQRINSLQEIISELESF